MFERILNSPWTWAAGALVSSVWEGSWLIGPPIGLTGRERRPYLIWGLIAQLICAIRSFYVLLRENEQLKRRLDERDNKRKAREAIGKLLEQLAQYERDAYNGSDGIEYDGLLIKIGYFKVDVSRIAKDYLDGSFESRVLAVNALDTPLDKGTQLHFTTRAQASFWTVYQQLKGWRICLKEILDSMGS